jgi:hypothetical protein
LQVPSEQMSPEGHAAAQAPQLFGSVFKLEQVPSQSASPDWHDSLHEPPVHTSPAGQTVPHAPQLFVSVFVFEQTPLQAVRPDWHDAAHTPEPLQTRPTAHAVPHVALGLQYSLLVRRLTHVESQFVSPARHVTTHVDALHTVPEAHALPTDPAPATPQPDVAPQKRSLVVGSTHPPPQAISPLGHDTTQVPELHTSPPGHAVPQAPQFS